MRSLTFKSLFFAATFLLAACVSTPMPMNHKGPDYANLPQLRFDVAEVMVLNDGTTTPLTQELAGKFNTSPEDALREWAGKRIQAVGSAGSYTIIIKDANFVAHKLPTKSGVKGYFERQQAARWDAYMNVMLAVEGSAQMLPPAEININIRTSQTLPENASETEKEQTYRSILNKLMALFDAEAQKQMDAYFRAYYR